MTQKSRSCYFGRQDNSQALLFHQPPMSHGSNWPQQKAQMCCTSREKKNHASELSRIFPSELIAREIWLFASSHRRFLSVKMCLLDCWLIPNAPSWTCIFGSMHTDVLQVPFYPAQAREPFLMVLMEK